MKALTVVQPWATLIALGAKRIETRSWSTSCRGPLAIHAARLPMRHYEQQELHADCRHPAFLDALRPTGMIVDTPRGPEVLFSKMPFGSIVAVCDLVGCVRVEALETAPITPQEYAFGNYEPGRWAWKLANVYALTTPIPVKGALGLWALDAATLDLLHARTVAS